jgi:hypothetical protein
MHSIVWCKEWHLAEAAKELDRLPILASTLVVQAAASSGAPVFLHKVGEILESASPAQDVHSQCLRELMNGTTSSRGTTSQGSSKQNRLLMLFEVSNLDGVRQNIELWCHERLALLTNP